MAVTVYHSDGRVCNIMESQVKDFEEMGFSEKKPPAKPKAKSAKK